MEDQMMIYLNLNYYDITDPYDVKRFNDSLNFRLRRWKEYSESLEEEGEK